MKNKKEKVLLGVIIGVVVFIIVILLSSIKTIPTGYVGVKTRFGEVQEISLNEGINLKAPFIEKIVKIDCRTQIFENEEAFESSTKDMQVVKNIYSAINFSVNKETANTLYQKIGEKYKNILIEPAIQESVRSAFSQFTAEELIVNRNKVSGIIKETLSNKLKDNGITIQEVSIKNFDFSDEYNQAIEKKATTQQEVEKAKAELEKSQIDNQKQIEKARAEVEIMKQQNQEITEKTLELRRLEMQEKLIDKWNGQLPTTVTDEVMSIFNK